MHPNNRHKAQMGGGGITPPNYCLPESDGQGTKAANHSGSRLPYPGYQGSQPSGSRLPYPPKRAVVPNIACRSDTGTCMVQPEGRRDQYQGIQPNGHRDAVPA